MAEVRRQAPISDRALPMLERRYGDWSEVTQLLPNLRARRPARIPDGFRLTALQSFVPEADGNFDNVVGTYTGPGDAICSIDQFLMEGPEEVDLQRTLAANPPPEIAHGVLDLKGITAYWMAGTVSNDADGQRTGWDRTNTVLTWSEGRTGYRIQARGLALADLVQLALGLRP